MRARLTRPREFLATLLLAAAALVQGACAVQVDGAPCSVPGTTTDCPANQACGNDLRCSARALSCASSRCTPDATRCSSTRVSARCERADAVCGRWIEEDCAARGLECGTRGSGACECPEYASTVVVADPRGSPSRDAFPFPRGQAFPRECSFGKLADALVTLSATTAPATVTIAGEPGEAGVFGAATGEPWPLVVPANVTIRAAPAPAGPSVIRAGADPALAGTLVRVLGMLDGLRIEGGGARAVGVELACGQGGTPTLRRVRVDGGGTLDPSHVVTAGLRAGVSVSNGACAALLMDTDVTGVAGPALAVEPGAGTVEVVGGSYGGSEIGVWLRGGTTTLVPDGASSVTVSDNAWLGILVGGGLDSTAPLAAIPGATLDHVAVSRNGAVGVVVSRLDEASSSVRLSSCDVSENGRARVVMSGPAGIQRQVGGVLVSLQTGSRLEYAGNRLWSNSGDQLVVETDSSWSLGVCSCGAGTNLFACVSPGPTQWALRHVGSGFLEAACFRWPGDPSSYATNVNGTSKICTGSVAGEPVMPTCPP
jgi:hypothetical protein